MSLPVLPVYPYSFKCRGCLTESGEMKNMYEWGLCEDFYKFTDVKVNRSEGITELLCSGCESILNQCKSFRIQCLRSNLMLQDYSKTSAQNPIKLRPMDHREDILKEDIKHCTIKETEILIMFCLADPDSQLQIPCPFKCKTTYKKRRDLFMHILKHNIDKNIQINLQFYCPYIKCSYFIDSGKDKYFKEKKQLNQHINKVHIEKKLTCEMCKEKFAKDTDLYRHMKTCTEIFRCSACHMKYTKKERLLVHLLRKHPDLHKEYKNSDKGQKSLHTTETIASEAKRRKIDDISKNFKSISEYMFDSPKRTSSTQTLNYLKNDVSLANLDHEYNKNSDEIDRNFSTIETQTVFEDLLSLKSQNSCDESLFFSDTVSDIQTQTFPIEFGISSMNKETNTSEIPDLMIKETQTCICLFDSPRTSFTKGLFDSATSSPSNVNLMSTQTQTADISKYIGMKSDVMLSLNSTQTQTCFDEDSRNDGL